MVVPLSVLFNWVLELRKFCPQLRVLRIHTNDSAEQQRLRDILTTFSTNRTTLSGSYNCGGIGEVNGCETHSYDVVVTTYEMIKGKMEVSFRRVFWRTMVLDEGHRIKNDLTTISKACLLFKARFKLVLTGTWHKCTINLRVLLF